ncbi:hypothetical protein [Micromonospora sp. NBS 11-29]|uniref:hypothetical protein n=1 Tax=Micromonospora sp. NBS 11-29 TaxID=1960879 RepID=UPI001C394CFD|nr:hypothetical protein [Micromonospora sp. NBS 11-29]
MRARTVRAVVALASGLAASAMAVTPAQAIPVEPPCPIGDDGCGGGSEPPPPGGGGGTPPAPAYTLQGVIDLEKYGHEGSWPYRVGGVKVRAYSRFANAGNNRVDADYINVRCYANDAYGHSTTDYDSENGGALVDVTFWSPVNPVTGVLPQFRTITVTCAHHATNNGVNYDTTSTRQFVVPE